MNKKHHKLCPFLLNGYLSFYGQFDANYHHHLYSCQCREDCALKRAGGCGLTFNDQTDAGQGVEKANSTG